MAFEEDNLINVWLILGYSSVCVGVDLPDGYDEDNDDQCEEIEKRAIEIVANDLNMTTGALASCVQDCYPAD